MKTVYCLRLQKGRFYVGQTPCDRLETRLWEHDQGGAKWTTRFPKQELLWSRQVKDSAADEVEDEENCRIMMKHGPNSCRGGTFNIGRDVRRMPVWAGELYRHYWSVISAAGLG